MLSIEFLHFSPQVSKNHLKIAFFLNFCKFWQIHFKPFICISKRTRNFGFTSYCKAYKLNKGIYLTPCKKKFEDKKSTPADMVRMGYLMVAGMGFEPHDLRVMSPMSYQTALPRDIGCTKSA